MKFFTNKSVVQKIVIATIIVVLCNFAAPPRVHADIGGILLSPLVLLVAFIFDQIYHLLEWAMLGETNNFMKSNVSSANMSGNSGGKIDINDLSEETLEFDGELLGFGTYKIPYMVYTPEEIFSNRVPALDVNFINPSVVAENETIEGQKHIAAKIQDIIASWYVAIRGISIVGLLTVLVYMGIRMMLTSIAADRAKYKQMLMDWLVAICLVFTLHFIMSFILTVADTITSLIASNGHTLYVIVPDGTTFNTNLMGFIRFMIQCTDLQQKVTFLILYIMLIIYDIRFTWTYLKRVVNMAFLTLFAPFVALTYPIDKVSDGKAQAFNMWVREFTFNALLQPMHLLLYTVLLGSAVQIAAENPLYAIVCLGFISAGEKLLKKMFGFEKASGGTLGAIAGTAGVATLASSMLTNAGKKMVGIGGAGAGGATGGKVRTKDLERTKDLNGGKRDIRNFALLPGSGQDDEGKEEGSAENTKGRKIPQGLNEDEQKWLDGYNRKIAKGDVSQSDIDRAQELRNKQKEYEKQLAEEQQHQAENGEEQQPPVRVSGGAPQGLGAGNQGSSNQGQLGTGGNGKKAISGWRKSVINAGNKLDAAAYRAKPVAYSALRGAGKMIAKGAVAGTMMTIGAGIAATSGDAEKTLGAVAAAGALGWKAGGSAFEGTIGKVARPKGMRDAIGEMRYGSAADAQNARADKQYFRSTQFDDFYNNFYKDSNMSKKDLKAAVEEYRKAGITSEADIRKGLKLEEEYMKQGFSAQDARERVQTIAQNYNDLAISAKALDGDPNERRNTLNRIEQQLGGKSPENAKRAKALLDGCVDWRNFNA